MKSLWEQIRLYPDKSFKIFISAILKPVGSRRYRRFIILSRKRTGSSLMHSYLNASPRVLARGEVFQRLRGRRYQDVLDWVFSRHPFFIRAVGFKIHYDHPADLPGCGLWDHLQNMPDLHVIHLRRKNILRSYLSEKTARQSGVWTTAQDSGPAGMPPENSPPIEFSSGELEAVFSRTRDFENRAAQRFAGHPVLEVDYETLIEQPEREIDRVADFLNVPRFHPRTVLKRQNPHRLADRVRNYHELKKVFAGTPWQAFFDE